jgi:hypothetical protein
MIAAIIFLATANWLYKHRVLMRYLDRIKTAYGPAIALIEKRSRNFPIDDRSEGAWAKKDTITAEISDLLSTPDIAIASWSLDGHHGARTLSAWNCSGVFQNPFYHAADNDFHVARFGKTFDGRPLIVFEGFVPDAIMKRYEIAVFTDSLDRR